MTLEILPPPAAADFSFHWFHSERSSQATIAQWIYGAWWPINETKPVTPAEMWQRGWELLGPVADRPHSDYLDR